MAAGQASGTLFRTRPAGPAPRRRTRRACHPDGLVRPGRRVRVHGGHRLCPRAGGAGPRPLAPRGAGTARRARHTGSWSGKSVKEAARYASVNVAASGEAGLALLMREEVDAVLLDVRQPGISGVDPRYPKIVEIEQRYVVGKQRQDEIPWTMLVGLIESRFYSPAVIDPPSEVSNWSAKLSKAFSSADSVSSVKSCTISGASERATIGVKSERMATRSPSRSTKR